MSTKTQPPRPRLWINIPDDLKEGLVSGAEKIGITRNALLLLAVRKGLAAIIAEYQPASDKTGQTTAA